jgi:hypothetical protein
LLDLYDMPLTEKGKRGFVDARQLIDMLRGRCGTVVIEKVAVFANTDIPTFVSAHKIAVVGQRPIICSYHQQIFYCCWLEEFVLQSFLPNKCFQLKLLQLTALAFKRLLQLRLLGSTP